MEINNFKKEIKIIQFYFLEVGVVNMFLTIFVNIVIKYT